MASIFDNKAAKWYERVQACFKRYKEGETERGGSRKVSQSELVRRLEARYPKEQGRPSLTQVNISRWLNYGVAGKRGSSMPSMEVAIMLADFFEVDVGYLLGETDYRSFTMEDAVNYLGLSEHAIEHIRLATRFDTAFRSVHMLPLEAGKTISSLLGSAKFFDLVMALEEMDRVYNGPDIQKKLFRELEEKYGSETVAEALEFEPYEHEGEEVDPVFREAYIEVQDAMDKMYAANNERKAYEGKARYELTKAFEEVVRDLYPE